MPFFKMRKTGRETDLGEKIGKRDCTYSIILGLRNLKLVGKFSWQCVRGRQVLRTGASGMGFRSNFKLWKSHHSE